LDETIFDKILQQKIPAHIVHDDEDVLAFHDINAQAPTHVLVIPKKKITGFDDLEKLSNEEAGKYIKKVSHIAKNLDKGNKGYRIVFNNGRDGQQTVNYIHAHILLGRQLKWPPG